MHTMETRGHNVLPRSLEDRYLGRSLRLELQRYATIGPVESELLDTENGDSEHEVFIPQTSCS